MCCLAVCQHPAEGRCLDTWRHLSTCKGQLGKGGKEEGGALGQDRGGEGRLPVSAGRRGWGNGSLLRYSVFIPGLSQQLSFPALYLRELPSGYLHARASAQPAIPSADRGFSPAPDWRGLGADKSTASLLIIILVSVHKRPPEIRESRITTLLCWLRFLLLP